MFVASLQNVGVPTICSPFQRDNFNYFLISYLLKDISSGEAN